MIEQRKSAIEIDGLENDLVKQIKTANSADELIKAKQNEIKITKKAVDDAWSNLHDFQMLYDKQGTTQNPENQKRMRMMERNIEKIENQYQEKQRELEQLQSQAETERTKATELSYRLTNAQKRGAYQMDVIGTRFDQHSNQYGNLLNVDREYVDKAYSQLESSNLLKEIVNELKTNRELTEHLLELKQ